MKHHRLKRAIAFTVMLCFTSLTGAQPLYAVPANNYVPKPEAFNSQLNNSQYNVVGNVGNVTQTGQTAINTWQDFSIGADATINFKGPDGGFNSINLVTGGAMSEIYGQLNANNNGNIFLANPSGVMIGNSAQINVGSLYVTNKDLTNALTGINANSDTQDIISAIEATRAGTAELMSLGHIISTNPSVTFDGSRIVVDADRLSSDTKGTPMDTANLNIRTNDADNVVIGYTAYDADNGSYANAVKKTFDVTVADNNNTEDVNVNGYMWVENLDQLQAIGDSRTSLSGYYALRNSIDATETEHNGGFNPIGSTSGFFRGRFDGLGYNIFGLTIDTDTSNTGTGLFGAVTGAYIRNFDLNSGSVKGGSMVGSAVGLARGNSVIENITSSLSVTGNSEVGGIVGAVEGFGNLATGIATAPTIMSNLVNTGTVIGVSDGQATVEESGENVGGIVGYMAFATLGGNTYNLGSVTGVRNVGGIVGELASYSTIGEIGESAFTIYNQLNVTGGYNVGGIVGKLDASEVRNVANYGNVTAKGYVPVDKTINDKNNDQYDDTLYQYHKADGTPAEIDNVAVANAGGIVGRAQDGTITDALNEGDVMTATKKDSKGDEYYIAGNVGGIVGRGERTQITNAENKENKVAGAHNVGGIAGYLTGYTYYTEHGSDSSSVVDGGLNNGGDITATGARNTEGKALKENVNQNASTESFIIGNVGGIVGYLEGNDAKIKNSGNRGTVHSAYFDVNGETPETAKAANVGGVVGKVDTGKGVSYVDGDGNVQEADGKDALGLLREDESRATIYNSYNTGDVQGYTGVGGVAGMMYKGSVAGSYNTGDVSATRKADKGSNQPLNMGGVVGDTGAIKDGSGTVIYDVYNEGKIGDETYTYYGRHVGGVVGRLSGTLDKAYNTGDIYNGYSVTGGVVGWWLSGNISNVFNTGNVTAVNKDQENGMSLVGGIVGAANEFYTDSLSYSYNLGTIRSFIPWEYRNGGNEDHTGGQNINVVGGIIGGFTTEENGPKEFKGTTIDNVYTTGNIYAARETEGADGKGSGKYEASTKSSDGQGGGHYLHDAWKTNDITYKKFDRISPIWNKGHQNAGQKVTTTDAYYIKPKADSGFNVIPDSGRISGNGNNQVINTYVSIDADKGVNRDSFKPTDKLANEGWEGFTYIDNLQNAPAGNNYETGWRTEDGNLPMLYAFTPDMAKNECAWKQDNMVVQYGTAANPLLTIIYAGDTELDWTNLGISGAASIALYGGDLTLTNFDTGNRYYGGTLFATGDLTIGGNGAYNFGSGSKLYGSNVTLGSTASNMVIYGSVTSTGGDITITGKDVEIIGSLKAATGENETIAGIDNGPGTVVDMSGLNNPEGHISSVSDEYAYTARGDGATGSVMVNASGNAEVLYGNLGTGSVTAGGDFKVESVNGNVYVDSNIGGVMGDITLGAAGEVLLDITNIAKANETDGDNGASKLHAFLNRYAGENGNTITLKSGTSDTIIAIDMWDYDEGAFNLQKYENGDKTLVGALDSLKLSNGANDSLSGREVVHIWVSDGDQLNGIQAYKTANADSNILDYSFALKGNVDATGVKDYQAIGSKGDKFTGLFDGRDYRIIGLEANGDNVGVFGTIGAKGTVKDLRVYASTIKGDKTAGAIAGVNEGTIENATTFGNRVEATGEAAGGIAGSNSGTIANSVASDLVMSSGNGVVAGGVAGVNSGTIKDTYSNSGVTEGNDGSGALGGVVGVNLEDGEITNAAALGVTNGGKFNASNVGGIAGENAGTVNNAYNDSIIDGGNNVGGVAGSNTGTLTNVANGAVVATEGTDVGGLAGLNSGEVTGGRNAGLVEGKENVGGMVGSNEKDGVLSKLSNALFASITGETNVGGVAGVNESTINVSDNLLNEGEITGMENVGGIAGTNAGTIEAPEGKEIILNVTDGEKGTNFGGVAGVNEGTINGAHTGTVTANGAEYVGGLAGLNTADGKLEGAGNSGTVTGGSYVGGVAGKNEAAINGQTIENSGTVTATAGGAGGLFGENSGAITNGSTLTNSGEVKGVSNTGGLIGVNSGNVTGSTLTNKGKVEGVSNTGGLIGVNSGNVGGSSLISTTASEVIGGSNVGGLVGHNTGSISGGRGEGENGMTLYTDKIYNNGTVMGATNVGGLIGVNANGGSLYAGYNTGRVTGNENVGGIAGANDGTIDSVFNTVMMEDEKNFVRGVTNVGGLVGNNTGTLSNAYNTTKVEGTASVGGLVGNNDGTLESAYNTAANVNLVGNGKDGTNTYNVTDADAQKNKDSYGTLTDEEETWKIYDGYSAPMLKVFLTEAKYNGSSITYDAQTHQANVNDVTAADGKAAYDKNNSLLTAPEHKNAGSWTAFYSSQIVSSSDGGFDPNVLGYDIEGELTIDKAALEITLGDVYRVYGNEAIKDKDGNASDYNFTFGGSLNDAMKAELEGVKDGVMTGITDGALYTEGGIEGKVTNDVDDYKWSAAFDENALSNYEVTVKEGNSYVTKADLVINVNDAETTYGTAFGDYGYRLDGLVNGDGASVIGEVAYSNTAAGSGEGGRWTADAGKYADAVGLTVGELANYNVKVNNGTATVKKADLTVTLGEVVRDYGNGDIKNGGYNVTDSFLGGLVNGDGNSGYTIGDLAVTVTSDGAVDGLAPGRTTADAGAHEWSGTVSGVDGGTRTNLSTNYNIKVEGTGKSTVNKAELIIKVNDAGTTYGTKFDESKYGHTYADGKGLVNGDDASILGDIVYTNGAALDGTGGKWTADAGTHEGAMGMLHGELKNYNVTINEGDAKITKAELVINVNDAETTYGTAFGDYGYRLDGLVNGDGASVIGEVAYSNTAAGSGEGGRWTADAGQYAGAVGLTVGELANYNVKVNNGTATVNKAALTIAADDQSVVLGNVPVYTGTTPEALAGMLVNGDTLGDFAYAFGITDEAALKVIGLYPETIGMFVKDAFYGGGLYDGAALGGVFANYNVTVEPGSLRVVSPEEANWGHLHDGWDRVRNFRERKAEIFLHEGGMEHVEGM